MISVTILTKNSEETLASCLKALESFSEVILLDTGSTDLTLDIGRSFSNVKIYETEFKGFGPLHNLAAEKTSHDWVLSIDSDEIITEELVNEIQNTNLNPNCLYSFPFNNYFNGKLIRGCGWFPDRHTRLYNKTQTCFTHDALHETIQLKHLTEVRLKNVVKHYSYRSISDFLKKMEHYSSLFASQNRQKMSASLTKAIAHSVYAFIKSYLFKKGFADGQEGFIISIYNAQTAFYKYLKLKELKEKDAALSPLSSRWKR